MSKRDNYFSNFLLLLLGQSVSQLGTGMTGFALVIWAYTQKGQVMSSSLLAICGTLPYLITGLFGGAVADNGNKKRIMLICDAIAACGSVLLFACSLTDSLHLWILCIVNMINGFMNAFQNPASQVAVSLLVKKEQYAKAGGIQSAANSFVGILTPILAAGVLSIGGLKMVLLIDIGTFLFAFLTLLLLIQLPDYAEKHPSVSFADIVHSIGEGVCFIRKEQGLLILLLMYSVLEFVGAISFDSMYSPLLLARTNHNEMTVGIVSAFMAVGSVAASLLIAFLKQPKKKIPVMYIGSFMCLFGITLSGMGRNIYQWCFIVFMGCFGAPIYQTYQTVMIREKVSVDMQGRIFSLQGMITQMLAPVGFLSGAIRVDCLFEPFMQKEGAIQSFLSVFVGNGTGSEIGLIFVIAGVTGIFLLLLLGRNPKIRALE